MRPLLAIILCVPLPVSGLAANGVVLQLSLAEGNPSDTEVKRNQRDVGILRLKLESTGGEAAVSALILSRQDTPLASHDFWKVSIFDDGRTPPVELASGDFDIDQQLNETLILRFRSPLRITPGNPPSLKSLLDRFQIKDKPLGRGYDLVAFEYIPSLPVSPPAAASSSASTATAIPTAAFTATPSAGDYVRDTRLNRIGDIADIRAPSGRSGKTISPPLATAHRNASGSTLDVSVDAENVLRPTNKKALGVSFFLPGDGDPNWTENGECRAGLPLDWNGNDRLVTHLCGNFEPAVRDLHLQMTRVYDLAIYDRFQRVGQIPWYAHFDAKAALDHWAKLSNRLAIPQENMVLGIHLYTTAQDPQAIYPTPDFWRDVVQYSVHRGYRFKHWEIGNEVYIPIPESATGFVLNGFYDENNLALSVERFRRYFIAVSNAIRSVQPDAKVGLSIRGPDDITTENTWTDRVLRATAGYYDFLVGHYYNLGCGEVGDDAFERFVLAHNYALLQAQLSILERARNLPGNTGKPIYHYDTEWGAHGWRDQNCRGSVGAEVRNGNTYGTMQRAIRLIYYLREGIVEGASTWAMFTRDRINDPAFGLLTHAGPGWRSMVYWLYRYFQQFSGDWILNIDGSAPFLNGTFQRYPWPSPLPASGPYTPVLAAKSGDGRQLYLIIANANERLSYDFRVSLRNFLGAAASGYLLRDYRRGSWKDNNPFSTSESDFVRPHTVNLSPEGNTLTGNIPAHSVLFVRILK
ncbi:MAG: hypothetical protein QXS96_07785 [Candidatus Caldarchaeum sp.]